MKTRPGVSPVWMALTVSLSVAMALLVITTRLDQRPVEARSTTSAEGAATTVADGAAGGDAGATAEQARSTATLSEFAVALEDAAVGVGSQLVVENEGTLAHNLAVDGFEEPYSTPDLQTGGEEVLELDGLEAGTYTVYCTIAGHREAGMEAELTVAEGGAGEGAELAAGDDAAAAPTDGEGLEGMEKAEWLRANYEASVAPFPAETAAHGNQKFEPEILEDGTKVFELTLGHVDWEVAPGEIVDAIGYNGQVPGPWIDVEVGDRITIRVVNELTDEATTLHPHGIFMHPFAVDGVGMISMDPIMPGDSWEQTFVAQEPSVGMYHGHDNGVQQVLNGAFGPFTVGDMPLPPEADNVVDEQVMVLNDAGNIGLTLNAKSFPATEPYSLVEGEQMILHYYNEGLSAHPMHLHNNAQMVIAKDGYPLAVPYVADTINIAPGERYTVVVFAESPGTWVFHCHILTHVERDDGSVFGMFTALVVEPSDDPDVAADLSRKLGRDRMPSIRQDLIEAGPPSAAAASAGGSPTSHEGHDMEEMEEA